MDAGFDSEAATLEMLRICLYPPSLTTQPPGKCLLTNLTNSIEVLRRILQRNTACMDSTEIFRWIYTRRLQNIDRSERGIYLALTRSPILGI